MTDSGPLVFAGLDSQPSLPVRRLHNYVYCPRLFYYQWAENLFVDNADTVEGRRAHRNVDSPSRIRDPAELDLHEGAKIRSLKLESETLGLIGVVDLVEDAGDGTAVIDYKKGSARRDENGDRCAKEADAIQVVAHAMLLMEHRIHAVRGWVYYAADKRRVPVDLSKSAFAECRAKIEEAKRVAAENKCPPPLKNDPKCLYCSAYPICLPNESAWWAESRRVVEADSQMRFEFAMQEPDVLRDRIMEAMEEAAAAKGKVVLEPPRP